MSTLFLGVIAVSVLAMAIVQVGALIYAARIARRVDALSHRLESDLKPLISNLQSLTAEATRAVTLASTQVERVDRALADVAGRIDQTLSVVQHRILAPVKEGAALMAGLRAALSAFRGMSDTAGGRRRSAPVDEEDALFIG